MDTLAAYAMGQLHKNQPIKTFDWIKAANILKEHQVKNAAAYLFDDAEWTSGMILENGEPANGGAYLSSNWAIPMLSFDGIDKPCWVYEKDIPESLQGHEWPEEAKAILKAGAQ